MNDDTNNLQANTSASPPSIPTVPNSAQNSSNSRPDATLGSRAKPPGSSSGSPLKLIIPIVMLVAVVFGVTLISQYTPKKPTNSSKNDPGDSGSDKSSSQLKWGSSIRSWDPRPMPFSTLQDHYFPGFYEGSEALHGATFWFENGNPAAVTMQLAAVSCTKCSSGRMASIPPEITDQFVTTTIFSGLPQGLVSGLPLAVAGMAAKLSPDRLTWQRFVYRDSPHAEYKIPAAPGGNHLIPGQWGIFELQFQIEGLTSAKRLDAYYTVQVDGSPVTGQALLSVVFDGVDSFDVTPKLQNVGDLTEYTEPRTFEFIVYSSTRGPDHTGPNEYGDLAPPVVDIRMPGNVGSPGPFISVSPAVRLTDVELMKVFEQVSTKRPIRVESAYRYTVTVKPKVGEERLDLGLLEREIYLALPDSREPKVVHVRGMVKGPVWLDNSRTDIDLTTYRAPEGTSQTIRLICEERDAELALVESECRPKFVQFELKKLPPAADRGYYELRIQVPKNSPTGSWNGIVKLEIKGSRPQPIRIPIRGSAKF
jgi:hypothetical protein